MSNVRKSVKQVQPLTDTSVELHGLAQTSPAEESEGLKQGREFIWRKGLLDRMNRPTRQSRAGVVRKRTFVCNPH